MNAVGTNWAGNITFGARRLHHPASMGELCRIVSNSSTVRALGTGHSFNRVADTTGDLVSLAAMPRRIELDVERREVTVNGALRYGELAPILHDHGFALHNLGSLPHISVAGAIATGTHGSGAANGILGTAVRALEIVTATGDVVTVDATDTAFNGLVVSLGSVGIVTQVTLAVEPSFTVRQFVYESLPESELEDHFFDIIDSAYSVSLFTDWRGPEVNQIWLKVRDDIAAGQENPMPSRWFGAALAAGPRHPVPGMSAANCTEQLGRPGAWHERLPHFRLGFTPSSGAELQSEYLVPREHALAALGAIGELREQITPVLQISELRSIAADELWLSPAQGRESIGIHFTWVPDGEAVRPVLAAIEERLAPFDARPHWGKVFTVAPDQVQARYRQLPRARALFAAWDPSGKFRNELVDRHVLTGRP